MQHVDDHILVLNRRHIADVTAEMICPFTANPERRRGKCGYFEHCGCQADYARTADKMLAYFDVELDLYDWIDGYAGDHRFPTENGWLGLHGDAHEDCPRTPGQQHQQFDGEIMVPGTTCGYQGLLEELGADLYRDQIKVAGRYVVKIEWFGPDGEFEFEVVEKLEAAR